LSRQTDPAGILKDRAGRTSVTLRSPQAPPAAVIDPQWARTADSVPKASRGWKRPRKVNSRQRHIAVDVTCLLLAAIGRARVRQRLLLAAGE